MSRQDLLVHHVHDLIKRNEPEEEIIAILTSHKIPKAEVNEILNICRWKSNYNTLPKQFVAEVLHFIHYYDSHRNPSEIGQQYLHHVFPFLSGADLVSLHIAFGKRGQMIEDFCKQYITQNPVMGVVLNINDRYNFPAYQPDTTHNYKFLYHLLFCYPDVHILGGYYSRSRNTGLEPQTCIALYHHRQYLIEKALKGGGIAFCLNVLNRIVFDEKYERARAPKPKSILPSFADIEYDWDHYIWHSLQQQLSHLYRIPKLGCMERDECLFHMFTYFGSASYKSTARHEQFQRENDIDEDDTNYKTRFFDWEYTIKYKAMTKFIQIVKTEFPEYCWDDHLAKHLCLVSERGYHSCAKLLMTMAAKSNS
eukprot:371716_1